jgi:hypothetical protein
MSPSPRDVCPPLHASCPTVRANYEPDVKGDTHETPGARIGLAALSTLRLPLPMAFAGETEAIAASQRSWSWPAGGEPGLKPPGTPGPPSTRTGAWRRSSAAPPGASDEPPRPRPRHLLEQVEDPPVEPDQLIERAIRAAQDLVDVECELADPPAEVFGIESVATAPALVGRMDSVRHRRSSFRGPDRRHAKPRVPAK